jgi:Ca2+:H+ antiporter
VSLILYGSFLFVQTVRHRDYFLPAEGGGDESHALPPPNRTTLVSVGLLFVSLVVVVVLAKVITPEVEHGIVTVGAPRSVVGIVIAGLVFLPEGLASYRAASVI